MDVLFYLGCLCGAILIGFLIGMFFTYWLINEDDECSLKGECKHEGKKHGVVIESHCTVEKIDVICDQCGQVVKTVIET